MLSLVFIFYRTLDLDHLERAIYSLARQTGLGLASELVFVDNNTAYEPEAIRAVVEPHFQEPFVKYHFLKHGVDSRRHSWSANYGIRAAANEDFFFTRADFILMEDCLERMAMTARESQQPALATGWGWYLARSADEAGLHIDVPYEDYDWRNNVRALLQYPSSLRFHDTALDAGVFVTSKAAIELGGWYDEAMINFGFQQSTLQRHMSNAGVYMVAIEDYLFCHQHHAADRNFERAWDEYIHSRGG